MSFPFNETETVCKQKSKKEMVELWHNQTKQGGRQMNKVLVVAVTVIAIVAGVVISKVRK